MTIENLINEVAAVTRLTFIKAEILVKDWLGFPDMDEDEQDEVLANIPEYNDYILGKAELYAEKNPNVNEQEEVISEIKVQEVEEVIVTPQQEVEVDEVTHIETDEVVRESSTTLLTKLMKDHAKVEGFTIADLIELFQQNVKDRVLSNARIRGIIKALLAKKEVTILNLEEKKNIRYSLKDYTANDNQNNVERIAAYYVPKASQYM